MNINALGARTVRKGLEHRFDEARMARAFGARVRAESDPSEALLFALGLVRFGPDGRLELSADGRRIVEGAP